jgi:hypothetical protein
MLCLYIIVVLVSFGDNEELYDFVDRFVFISTRMVQNTLTKAVIASDNAHYVTH